MKIQESVLQPSPSAARQSLKARQPRPALSTIVGYTTRARKQNSGGPAFRHPQPPKESVEPSSRSPMGEELTSLAAAEIPSATSTPTARGSSEVFAEPGQAFRISPPRKVLPSSLLTYAEAANTLAVSINHVRNLIRDGHMRSIKVGARGRRVSRAEVQQIVEHGIK